MKGKLVKVCSNGYTVRVDGVDYPSKARGKLKLSSLNLAVGDEVEYEKGVIVKVYERRNSLIRPRVSNIDGVVIVIASEPKPDYYLVDKVLIASKKLDVETLIVVNKSDKENYLYNEVKSQYDSVCKVITASAKDKLGISEIKEFIKGKTVVLAGQSAVGKTSLINAIFSLDLKVGELSEKISRGKHTTTYSEIFEKDEMRIIDTPGFAVIEAEVTEDEIASFYPEYFDLSVNCRFRSCTHLSEPDCAVISAVERGELSKERYLRYKEIITEIKNRRKDYGKN